MIGLNTNYSYMPLVLGNHTVAAPRSKEKCLAACSFLFPFALSPLFLRFFPLLSPSFPPLSYFPRKRVPPNLTFETIASISHPRRTLREKLDDNYIYIYIDVFWIVRMNEGWKEKRREEKRYAKMEERKGGKEEGLRRIRAIEGREGRKKGKKRGVLPPEPRGIQS